MKSQKLAGLVGAIAVATALLVAIQSLLRRGESRLPGPAASTTSLAHSSLAPVEEGESAAERESDGRAVIDRREAAPASAGSMGSTIDGAQSRRDAILANLRSAIEASTFERLDPAAVLEAARLILECELGSPVPEVTDNGEILIPFVGTPPGVSAHMTVASSRYWGQVLGMEITLHAPDEPLYLNGTLRNEASCRITAWTKDGELDKLGMRTFLDLDFRRMRQSGMSFDDAVEGVQYTLDVHDPSASKLSAYGWRRGKPADWQVPTVLDGGHPAAGDADWVNHRMLSLHEGLKRKAKQ